MGKTLRYILFGVVELGLSYRILCVTIFGSFLLGWWIILSRGYLNLLSRELKPCQKLNGDRRLELSTLRINSTNISISIFNISSSCWRYGSKQIEIFCIAMNINMCLFNPSVFSMAPPSSTCLVFPFRDCLFYTLLRTHV
jgi:hypothetical protein